MGTPPIFRRIHAGAQEGLPNEPDLLEAYDAVTGDWRAALLTFAEDRVRMGTSHHPGWADYTLSDPTVDVAVGLAAELNMADLPAEITPTHMLYETGAVYVAVHGLEPGAALSIEIAGDSGTQWGTVVVEGEAGLNVASAEATWVAGGDTVVVGAVNLGRADIDADPDPDGRSPFPGVLEQWGVAVHLAQVVPEKADAVDEKQTGGAVDGCGCSSGPAPGWTWAAMVVLGLRRRRSHRV